MAEEKKAGQQAVEQAGVQTFGGCGHRPDGSQGKSAQHS